MGPIVRSLVGELQHRQPLVDEVVVVDDGSSDGTAMAAHSAGARVVRGDGRDKGGAMQRGVRHSVGDIVVFCDADLHCFDPSFVVGLLGPLLVHDGLHFVKGCYERPFEGRQGEGGRVTELVAKPLLRTFFPHLGGFGQPLAGECAARREILAQVPFVQGYGVDIALLIDLAGRLGVHALAQVDLGRRVHRNRPLEELAPQAEEVLRTALSRAGTGAPVAEWPALAEQAPVRL